METTDPFDPSLQTYLLSCGNFLVRYFLVAGGVYWLLHGTYRDRWFAHRVQSAFPKHTQARYEIFWSLVNAACTGLSAVLIYRLTRAGQTAIYLDVAAFGWAYFVMTIGLCILGYDTWFYWQHRLLHTPWLYLHAHSIHHRVTNPTVFASFASHPIETFMGNLYFILFVVLVPVHPIALGAAGLYMFATNLMLHSGYEFFPRAVASHPLLRFVNTSTYHNLHHRDAYGNYGSFLTCWDRWMGSTHPASRITFDEVQRKVRAAASERAVA